MTADPSLASSAYTLEVARSFRDISASDWDRCAGADNPFVSYAFLSALEDSGCIGRGTSWLPLPVLLREACSQRICAVAPSFVKLDSKGEYIFDYAWADAYERLLGAGKSYYPKIQVAVPFTPVPGPRLMVSPELDEARQAAAQKALLGGLLQLAEDNDFSSVHVTFCSAEISQRAQQGLGFLPRLGEQFHWLNNSYSTFENFLSELSSRKRKAIKKERRIANSHGLDLRRFHAPQMSVKRWDEFFSLYEDTSLRKWGQPYLNREFFTLLAERLGAQVVLFLALDTDDSICAGAWNLLGTEALFGRNWGSRRPYDMLHFEICYYRAIEYAIETGLQRVEAGAQGFHKVQRGYRPVPIHSAHYLMDSQFQKLVSDHLRMERAEEFQRLQAISELVPFKKES